MPSHPDNFELRSEVANKATSALVALFYSSDTASDRKEWKSLRHAQYKKVKGMVQLILRGNNNPVPEQLFTWSTNDGVAHRVIVCACTQFRMGYTHTQLLPAGKERLIPVYHTSATSLATVGNAVGHVAAAVDVVLAQPGSPNDLVMPRPPRGIALASHDATDFWYYRSAADAGAPHLPEPQSVRSLAETQRQYGVLIEADHVLTQCLAASDVNPRQFKHS